MKAFQLIAHGAPGKFELRDVPEPKPQPGEVVVDVRACGLNHLDLWLEEAGLPIKVDLPRTPGGEVAGVISAIGARVPQRSSGVVPKIIKAAKGITPQAGWSIGDRVAVQSNLF